MRSTSKLRLDRLLTLYAFNQLQNGQRLKKRDQIPILMYHSISTLESNDRHPYYETTTSPHVFEMHMKYLKENGYTTICLNEAQRILSNGVISAVKPVVITFDDGFRDFDIHAFPVMTKYDLCATVFLPTNFVTNCHQISFKGKECLSWSQVRHLAEIGTKFGSHTVTHPELSALPLQAVITELERSKQTLEYEIGQNVDSFSYPFAFPEQDRSFIKDLERILSECGYTNGVTTKIGLASHRDNQFFLRRIPINDFDDKDLFEAKMNGSYDWLNRVQTLTKYFKSAIRRKAAKK